MDDVRLQFTFYASFAKAAERIRKKADRCDFYDILKNYALYGETPNLEECADPVAIAFELIRPTLDSSRKKAKSGKDGGKRKQAESKTEANEKQTESNQEANSKRGENAREKEKEDEKEEEKEDEKENECYPPTPLPDEKKQKRFTPPTVDEVTAYCMERENFVDPARFVDFYASKGWMIGKNPMKDWKAAVRTWEKGEDKRGADQGNPSPTERLGIYL